MIVSTYVTHCDVSDRAYVSPVLGAAAIARGATGRWCEVLWFGPEVVEQEGYKTITREEAYAKIEARGNGDYADF